MHTQPRNGPIEKVVVHVNVGPEVEGGAAALAQYLTTINGGYHAICDDRTTVTTAADDLEVWGNGGINSTSLDVCIIGYADDPAQWSTAYARAAMHNAAQWVAVKCKFYGLATSRLTPAMVRTRGVKGVCGHVDVTNAGFPGAAGHYDPGPFFPWAQFLATVNTILNPPPTPNPLARLYAALVAGQVKYGDRGPKVVAVQRLLVKHHLPLTVNGVYDRAMAAGVLRFKTAHNLPNRNPNRVGVQCQIALLRAPEKP